MNKLPNEFLPGDYIIYEECMNKYVCFIVFKYHHEDDYFNSRIATVDYITRCEIKFNTRDQHGNPIWHGSNLFLPDEPLVTSRQVRDENVRFATDEEKKIMNELILQRGYIWDAKTMTMKERPLPDLSKGLLLNKDSVYCWHKVLKPYIGKVYFSEREDSQTNVYESPWHTIWNMILKEKMRREEKTHKVSFEMEEHMFEVLRTLYQAPLIKVSYPFHNEKQAKKAFIVAEKTNRYDDERGFVMGEPKLHLVTNMVHLTSAVCRYDLYKMITDKDSIHSDGLKVYLPNEK
jgi:hypothetical protein